MVKKLLRINRQTDYAVRMILTLAKRGLGVRLSTKEIQQECCSPRINDADRGAAGKE